MAKHTHLGAWQPCRALNRHGEPCWKAALAEPVIPNVPLCWSHTAMVLMDNPPRRLPSERRILEIVRDAHEA